MTPYSFSFEKNGTSDPVVFTAGQQFRFDIEQFEQFFKMPMPTRLTDLLRIASALYFVDRMVRRRRKDHRRHWSRTLAVNVGVLEPDFWSSDPVRECLTETLEFLSDDSWTLAFSKDDRRPPKEIQRILFNVPSDSRVCLYSGGLDSAAGFGTRLAQDPSKHILPVTVWHQPIQRKLIEEQFQLFSAKHAVQITPLVIKAAMIWTPELKRRFRGESSQRSRAFLFTVTGAVAAAMAGSSSVELYESGIGAINFPLMTGMVGSRTTRGTHPAFLKRMSQLLSLVCDKPIAFQLPFLDYTKGQVVQMVKESGFADILEKTVSCVHFPLRESDHKQCGICPACIFRRQALQVAGIRESDGTYKYDLFTEPAAANRTPKRQLKYLKAFLDQAIQLEEVQVGQPIPPRFRRHVYGTGVLAVGDSTEPIGRLLSIYRGEWFDIVRRAQKRGFSWTKLVGSRTSSTEGPCHAVA